MRCSAACIEGRAIVVPGAFTRGTDDFPSAGKPADAATAAAYSRYDGVMDQIGARLSALTPDEADPQAVADEIVRIVGLPAGTKPAGRGSCGGSDSAACGTDSTGISTPA